MIFLIYTKQKWFVRSQILKFINLFNVTMYALMSFAASVFFESVPHYHCLTEIIKK